MKPTALKPLLTRARHAQACRPGVVHRLLTWRSSRRRWTTAMSSNRARILLPHISMQYLGIVSLGV